MRDRNGNLSALDPYNQGTSRRVADGGLQRAGSRGAHAIPAPSSIPLPSGSLPRPEPFLERGYVSQALLDAGALIFLSLFIVSAALSVPLALFLLIFARF
jgi:hypothetical protein